MDIQLHFASGASDIHAIESRLLDSSLGNRQPIDHQVLPLRRRVDDRLGCPFCVAGGVYSQQVKDFRPQVRVDVVHGGTQCVWVFVTGDAYVEDIPRWQPCASSVQFACEHAGIVVDGEIASVDYGLNHRQVGNRVKLGDFNSTAGK